MDSANDFEKTQRGGWIRVGQKPPEILFGLVSLAWMGLSTSSETFTNTCQNESTLISAVDVLQ